MPVESPAPLIRLNSADADLLLDESATVDVHRPITQGGIDDMRKLYAGKTSKVAIKINPLDWMNSKTIDELLDGIVEHAVAAIGV